MLEKKLMKNIKWKIILVFVVVIITIMKPIQALKTEQKTINYSELIMSRSDAQIYANAFIYMLDLDMKMGQFGDDFYNIDVLNQEYVKCFDLEYLDYMLKNQHFNKFIYDGYSEEEIQSENYMIYQSHHEMMTEEEHKLLDEYNKYRYEVYKVYENNIDIIGKIAEKNGMTIEDMKSYKNGTPRSYDMFLGSDEEYSHLLEYAYISIPQDVSVYWIEKRAYNSYPFSYYVDNGYEDPFYTSHYDASLYGFDYPSVTGEFFYIYEEKIPDEDGIYFKNENYLGYYNVYNDCIEIKLKDSSDIFLVYINNGKITDIKHYEFSM